MNQPDLLLRDARPGEADEISGLLVAAYRQYEKSIHAPAWEAYLADIRDVRARLAVSELVVAEIGRRIVGAVTLYPASPDGSGHGWPAGWAGLRLLAVHPDYRGRGIGRRLMEECIRRCRGRGIAALGLHTTDLMDVARRMYERMGFRRLPEHDFHPAPGVVVTAYRLDLEAHDSSGDGLGKGA